MLIQLGGQLESNLYHNHFNERAPIYICWKKLVIKYYIPKRLYVNRVNRMIPINIGSVLFKFFPQSRSGEERKRNKNLSLHSIPQQGVSDDGQAEREQGHVDPKKTVIVSHGASNFSTSTSSLEQGEHCADVSPDSVPHPLQDQFTTGASSSIDSSDPGDVCDNQLSTTPQSQVNNLQPNFKDEIDLNSTYWLQKMKFISSNQNRTWYFQCAQEIPMSKNTHSHAITP